MAPSFGVPRTADIEYIPGATRFTDSVELRDPVAMVRIIKAQRPLLEELHRGFGMAFDPENPDDDPTYWDPDRLARHRPRMEGDWVLAFVGFCLSRTASMEGFHAAHHSSTLWRECGFASTPSYPTLNRRFTELEKFIDRESTSGKPLFDGFMRAARFALTKARSHEPMIGRTANIDSSGIATHAALIHCCPPGTKCGDKQLARAEATKRAGGRVKAPRRLGHGSRQPSTTVEEINAVRHELADKPIEEEEEARSSFEPLSASEIKSMGLDEGMRWYRLNKKGKTHYYCSADLDGGVRAYARKKNNKKKGTFWNGYYDGLAVDALTGGTLAVTIAPANEQEYVTFPRLIDQLADNLGGLHPHHITADKGLFVKSVFEYTNERGIAAVMPFRPDSHNKTRRDLENEVVDRHGVPRCRHCGAEGKRSGRGLGFTVTAHGTPVIRFKCSARITKDCAGIQQVICSTEPRMLGPVCATDAVYHQLRQIHSNREHAHLHRRQRYTVGGREVTTRDHRHGIKWQRLRAHCAMFLDWVRICLRFGWLGSLRSAPADATHLKRSATHRLAKTLGARLRWSLHLPYGPKAATLGVGWHDPPARTFRDRPEAKK